MAVPSEMRMDLHLNPLLASVPCGRIGDTPFRLGILTAFVLLALVFGLEPKSVERVVTRETVVNPIETVESTLSDSATATPIETERPQKDEAGESGPTAGVQSVVADEKAVAADSSAAVSNDTETPTGDASPAIAGPSLNVPATKVTREVTTLPAPNAYFYGTIVALVFLGSCLLHVIAERAVAQRFGADVDAIILLPITGLTITSRSTPTARMVIAAIGPIVHLALCLLCFPTVILWGEMEPFSAFSLPAVSFEEYGFASAGLLIFSINWKLFLLNLIPIPPLDAARLIRAWRAADAGHEHSSTARKWAEYGLLASMFAFGVGLLSSGPWFAALGGFLLAWACVDFLVIAHREADDETVLGYDFSEGYTSLEREDDEDDDVDAELPPAPREKSLGPIARWKAKKEAQKRKREREEREWAEKELDRLLDKVSQVGMDGLTPEEKKTLKQVSSRYKQ